MHWLKLQMPDAKELAKRAEDVRSVFPDIDPHQDIELLAAEHGLTAGAIVPLAGVEHGRLRGVAVFTVADTAFGPGAGPITLLRLPSRQFNLLGGPVVRPPEDRATIVSCLQTLADQLPANGVVHLSAVPAQSVLHDVLCDRANDIHRTFHVLPWGRETLHCSIDWPGSFDGYLASLGKVSRKDLRRSRKALFEDPTRICEVSRFAHADEVAAFMRDAVPISDKTYQKLELGLGLAHDGGAECAIRLAASRGAFAGYILYIDKQPVAFEYALVRGDTITMKQAGYDPAWAHGQVGSVLFVEIMRDLDQRHPKLRRIDLMPGLNLFKLRVTNRHILARHFYLLPRNRAGFLRYFALRSRATLESWTSSLLGRSRSDGFQKYIDLARSGGDASKS